MKRDGGGVKEILERRGEDKYERGRVAEEEGEG